MNTLMVMLRPRFLQIGSHSLAQAYEIPMIGNASNKTCLGLTAAQTPEPFAAF